MQSQNEPMSDSEVEQTRMYLATTTSYGPKSVGNHALASRLLAEIDRLRAEVGQMADTLQSVRIDCQVANDALRSRNRRYDALAARIDALSYRRTVDAIHIKLCEDSPEECITGRGKCVRAAESVHALWDGDV